MDISVVIPVRNEEKNLDQLITRLKIVFKDEMPSVLFEVIFVTDINNDSTFEMLCRHNEQDQRIKTIKLSNGFGQHVAIIAGLEKTSGGCVVLMDGDLQDYPEDIPALYKKLKDGYDIVYGVKEKKNDSKIRNLCSKTFNKLMASLADVKFTTNTSMFRILSRKAVEEVLRFQEREPSLTYIFGFINLPTANIQVTSGIRLAGHSNYGLMKLINFAISSLLSFSRKPLSFISAIGIFISALSFLFFIITLIQWFLTKITVSGWTTLAILISFLGGMQLLSIGIVGEYLGRVYLESKKRPLYIVEKEIGDFAKEDNDLAK